jgi:hypothetical protein
MFHIVEDIGEYVGFEVLTAVVTNAVILWAIAPCSLSVNRPFGRSTSIISVFRVEIQVSKKETSV